MVVSTVCFSRLKDGRTTSAGSSVWWFNGVNGRVLQPDLPLDGRQVAALLKGEEVTIVTRKGEAVRRAEGGKLWVEELAVQLHVSREELERLPGKVAAAKQA